MKNKFVSFGIVFVMIVSSLSMLITIAQEPVTPQDEPSLVSRSYAYFSGVERTWDASGDAAASAPASWDPVGVPATGDNITFDATSTFNANWDVEVTLGNFSMLTGYTGTVTSTVNFGLVNLTHLIGTLTGTASKTITCYGDWYHTLGTQTGNTINLVMAGDDATLTSRVTDDFKKLTITGNTTLASAGKTWSFDNSGTFDTDTFTFSIRLYSGATQTTYSNTGTIEGTSSITFFPCYGGDFTVSLGEINTDTSFSMLGSVSVSGTLYFSSDSVIDGDVTVISNHAANTLTLDFLGNDFSVTGEFTVQTKAIINQGIGTLTVGSYTQTGEDSIFNQGATVTIAEDFTVSDGVFNAIEDMTVPGNWTTTTGSYLNDDNVVTLTGASKTLAMNAADSFFNVTVSGSYTMDADTNVRLRATISGTVDGTGDFLEPEPEFTSVEWLKACPLELYDYEVTQKYWDPLSISEGPYWLNIYDGHIKGIPGENETGLYNISLALTWNDMTTYQNYTLIVCAAEEFVTFEFLMYFAAMLILLVINIVGACVSQVRILTLFGIFGIAILCVPTALVMIDYGPIALILILVNIMVPVMSTVNNIKDR